MKVSVFVQSKLISITPHEEMIKFVLTKFEWSQICHCEACVSASYLNLMPASETLRVFKH